MSLDRMMDYWSFQPEIWVILAILLVGADILLGLQFFVLAIGVAALLLSGVLFAQQNLWFGDALVIETWRGVGVWFSALSLVSIFLIKLVLRWRRGQPDINEY